MGKLFALLAAMGYGANTTLSRLTYDTGTDPVSLTIYRYAMIAALFAVIVVVTRKSMRVGMKWRYYLGCVFGMFAISLGHLGAVNYIPVSLAAIVFYTYPLQVIAYRRWINNQPTSWPEGAGFILAFIGLVIALGPDFHHLDWRGIVLAVFGSFGAFVFMISYEAFPDDADPYVCSALIAFGTFGLCCGILLTGIELTPPSQSVGWMYLWANAGLTVLALIFTVLAISRIGAKGTSLFLNIEPILILILAWIVLSESLTVARWAGALLVVASLLLGQMRGQKRTPQNKA